MRSLPLALALSGLLLPGPSFASTHTHRKSSAHPVVAHAVSAHGRHAVAHATVSHHSTAVLMNSERATQIQSALIKAGYMSGEPTGNWDADSVAAMQKLQGDNGWQTKIVPDSRALIKLGLGPGSTPAAAPQAEVPATPTVPPNETASKL